MLVFDIAIRLLTDQSFKITTQSAKFLFHALINYLAKQNQDANGLHSH